MNKILEKLEQITSKTSYVKSLSPIYDDIVRILIQLARGDKPNPKLCVNIFRHFKAHTLEKILGSYTTDLIVEKCIEELDLNKIDNIIHALEHIAEILYKSGWNEYRSLQHLIRKLRNTLSVT